MLKVIYSMYITYLKLNDVNVKLWQGYTYFLLFDPKQIVGTRKNSLAEVVSIIYTQCFEQKY